jgi:hypothetical protein
MDLDLKEEEENEEAVEIGCARLRRRKKVGMMKLDVKRKE